MIETFDFRDQTEWEHPVLEPNGRVDMTVKVARYLEGKRFLEVLRQVLKNRFYEDGFVVSGYAGGDFRMTRCVDNELYGAEFDLKRARRQGRVPLFRLHTHPIIGKKSYFPSETDIICSAIPTKGKETETVNVLLIPDRNLTVWIWQSPKKEDLERIQLAYKTWLDTRSKKNFTWNDCGELLNVLRENGVKVVVDKLDNNNPGGDLSRIMTSNGFKCEYQDK